MHHFNLSFTNAGARAASVFLLAASYLLISSHASARGFVAVGAYRAGVVRGYGYGYYDAYVNAPAVNTLALPAGYLRRIPWGYRMVYHGGVNCYYANGIYGSLEE